MRCRFAATPAGRERVPGHDGMQEIVVVDASEEPRCLKLFSCFGLIDMRAQAEVRSALRTDTPRSIRVEVFSSPVLSTYARKPKSTARVGPPHVRHAEVNSCRSAFCSGPLDDRSPSAHKPSGSASGPRAHGGGRTSRSSAVTVAPAFRARLGLTIAHASSSAEILRAPSSGRELLVFGSNSLLASRERRAVRRIVLNSVLSLAPTPRRPLW
jgi:hypothetical protein